MRRLLPALLLAACSSTSQPNDSPPPSATPGGAIEAKPLPAPVACAASPKSASGAPAVIVGDVTGDGQDDWLTVGWDGGTLVAGPLPGTTWSCASNGDGTAFTAHGADLNGDGHLDLIVPQPWESRVSIFFGPIAKDRILTSEHADVVYRGMRDEEIGGLVDRFGAAVVIADLTGDGVLDLLVTAPAEGEEACHGTRDSVLFAGPHARGEHFAHEAKTRIAATEGKCLGDEAYADHDVDGDGKIDLVVSEQSPSLVYRVFDLPLGSGTVTPKATLDASRPHLPAYVGDGAGGKTLVFVDGNYGGLTMAQPGSEPRDLPWPDNTYGWLSSHAGGRLGSKPRAYAVTTPSGVNPNEKGEVEVEIRALTVSTTSIAELPVLGTMVTTGLVTTSEGDLDGDGCTDLLVGNIAVTCR
jgi:hypothetical protein